MTKKTLIVSAFPGCGKTFLYETQNATFSISYKMCRAFYLSFLHKM